MQGVVSVFNKLVGINHSGLVITNIIPWCVYGKCCPYRKGFSSEKQLQCVHPSGKIRSVNLYLWVALLHAKQWIALKIYVWSSCCVPCHWALWCQEMIAVHVGGGFKLDEFYGNLKVRFSMRVKDERKLSYPLHQCIDNSGNTGNIRISKDFVKHLTIKFCDKML